MTQLFGQAVFDVLSRTYCWEDVVLAAHLWGDWTTLVTRTLQGLACQQRAEDSGEDPPTEAVEATADAFRYARDLLSAEQMEAWLSAWGLTADDWSDFIERSVLLAESGDDLPSIVARYLVTAEQLEKVLLVEAVCSGALGAAAARLAARAAVSARSRREAARWDATETDVPFWPVEGRVNDLLKHGLFGLSPEATRERLTAIVRLETSFQQFRTETLTPEAIEQRIRLRPLDWIRVDCERVSFTAAEVAREALLCVREDGRDLDAVAADAKVGCDRVQLYVDEATPELRDHLLSARKGDLLGPLRLDGRFWLYRIVDKVPPAADDPAVRRRAEADLLTSVLEREVNDRVRWRRQV